ncbi:MAG: pyrrolo-quinoline quinone, partial [Verrucomicrobiota bacterium]
MHAWICLVSVLFGLPLASGAEWNQWRGSDRNSQIAGSTPWPSNFDGLSEVWAVDLAEGYSSPVVWEDRVYSVETQKKKSEITRCFDLTTGEEMWSAEWLGSLKVPFFAAKNGSWVRSTP